MIIINNLCFGYDSTEVLHNINLHIERGSYTIVVGPNGGGKTTLLKLMLGLIEPVYGDITVLGKTPKMARRQVSYVPQSLQYDALFPVTVLDIVLMGRVDKRPFGLFRKLDREVAEASLEQVNLNGYSKRSFQSLSGGERQRVLIAQALASEPELLLLDEPGANLDPENRLQLYELLHSLTPKITVIMVSHNLNVVASVASHILCVNRTADIHRIEEVSQDALKHGAWTHLTHANCPVGNQDDATFHTPHCGKPHDNCLCHSCKK